MITVEKLREKYPHPVTSEQVEVDGAYCVGGAVCLESGVYGASFPCFPYAGVLATVLRQLNPNLSGVHYLHAKDLAARIIEFNDGGEFEEAWKALDEALRWEEPE